MGHVLQSNHQHSNTYFIVPLNSTVSLPIDIPSVSLCIATYVRRSNLIIDYKCCLHINDRYYKHLIQNKLLARRFVCVTFAISFSVIIMNNQFCVVLNVTWVKKPSPFEYQKLMNTFLAVTFYHCRTNL